MATITDPTDDDIRRLNHDSARLEAETRKLTAEADKLKAEQYKLLAEQLKLVAEQSKLSRDKTLSPWLLLAQGLLAGAALLGSALALLKYLVS